jgi:hypothetical protein
MASRTINSLLTKANRSPNGTILCGEGSGLIESWTSSILPTTSKLDAEGVCNCFS